MVPFMSMTQPAGTVADAVAGNRPGRTVLLGLCGLLAVGAAGLAFRRDRGAVLVTSSVVEPDGAAAVTASHDFATLRPGAKVTHRFAVTNATDETWTVREVTRTCNCTVARIEEPVVPPGGTLFAEVAYSAGASVTDDAKAVTVMFREPTAPPVRLAVTARVRRPLTLMPEELKLPGVRRDAGAEGHATLGNFTGHALDGMTVTSSADWLTAELVDLRQNAEGLEGAAQSWRAAVRADATGLPFGRHRAELTFASAASPGGPADASVRLPVSVDVRTPVAAIPGELFLPGAVPDETASKNLFVRFADETGPPGGAADAVIRHDLGDRLHVEWTKADGPLWTLAADLTPRAGDRGDLDGTITVQFAGDLPELEIPVRAAVRTGEPEEEE